MRLWLGRRGAASGGLFRRRQAIVLAALAVVSLAAGGLILAFGRHAGPASAARQQAAQAGASAGPVGHRAGGAAGPAAAVWVARQVGRDAMVACDPGMCRVLHARGFPAFNLVVLGPGAAGLRFCDVVVVTQAVRSLLGSRLQQQDAPAVLASFGSGAARVDVRAVAPGGAAAYRAALGADWADRRRAGAQLAVNPRVHAGHAARLDLLAGQVDSRLLITLAALAVSYPVDIVQFGEPAPGASTGLPVREMEISGMGGAAARFAELQRIRSFVLAQRSVFRPAQVSLVRLAGSGPALRIEFGAPSPLGLLHGRPVSQ